MSSIIKTIKMATLESSVLQSKFRGSLLGSLIGDCTGSPYEGDTFTNGDKIILQRYFDKLEEPNFKAPFKPYTDDTAMMKSVAKFLIDKPEPDYKFLAKLFVNEYFKQPKRGYGENVVDVFHKLRNSKFEDVFKPAREQFLGSGSYGNGGAMRIAPIALYCHSNYKTMLEIAANATKLTHTNILGVNGALLQCVAIQQALEHHPEEKIDPKRFCLELYLKMKKIEKTDEEDVEDADPALTAYQEKLKVVEHLLGKRIDTDLDEEVIFCLGNGISSYESVPTAIYCFLRAQSEIPHIKEKKRKGKRKEFFIWEGELSLVIFSGARILSSSLCGFEEAKRFHTGITIFGLSKGITRPQYLLGIFIKYPFSCQIPIFRPHNNYGLLITTSCRYCELYPGVSLARLDHYTPYISDYGLPRSTLSAWKRLLPEWTAYRGWIVLLETILPYPMHTDNVFRRTIQYAISLGGDTDTIACMAGAIAGAHLGEEAINADLARHCEFSKEIIEVADNLFMARAVSPTTS